MSVTIPVPTTSIVDNNGLMNTNFRTWTQQVTKLAPLEGSGSPEGVFTAGPTRGYIDTVAEVGYIKQSGFGKTGWILV